MDLTSFERIMCHVIGFIVRILYDSVQMFIVWNYIYGR